MKYLIVGLGNMGVKYDDMRYNVGFDVVDVLVKEFDVEWKYEYFGDIVKGKYKGWILVLLKLLIYMNLSGKFVCYWMNKEKIKKENFLVIVDDFNFDFGK